MKKYIFTILTALASLTATAQGSRGIKIAYIDMNYILDKVPDYAEAKNQLEQKATQWKQELEVKRNEINKLKQSLQTEKALLTKELIEEREEEISYLETDLLTYQEKRFGPTGDLMSQKAVLVKPIQDQVFTIVQDLAEVRKYDYVFDKSSDLTMLFSAKKHDISDLIIKRMSRAAKTERLSSKELKKLEEDEAKEERESDPEFQDRQKILDERKSEKERKIEERKAAQNAKREAFEAKREQMRLEREAKRNGTAKPAAPATTAGSDEPENANRPSADAKEPNSVADEPVQGENAKEVKTTATEKPEAGTAASVKRQTDAQAAKEERDRKIEERKRQIEENRQRKQAEREAAQKAREEQIKERQQGDKPGTTEPAQTEETTPAQPAE